jgi:hypothetical protein
MPETLTTASRVDVAPLAGHIGAEITGVQVLRRRMGRFDDHGRKYVT